MKNSDNITKIKKKKTGQAAIEFLVVYGWAILAVFLIVGALIYFGVFNFSQYTNDLCSFGEEIKCEDYSINKSGLVRVQLRNSFEVPIDINKTIMKTDYGNVTCPATAILPSNLNILSGGLVSINCNATSSLLVQNSKMRVRFLISYQRNGIGNPLHNITGELYTAVTKS